MQLLFLMNLSFLFCDFFKPLLQSTLEQLVVVKHPIAPATN